jgi:hypothetical protein
MYFIHPHSSMSIYICNTYTTSIHNMFIHILNISYNHSCIFFHCNIGCLHVDPYALYESALLKRQPLGQRSYCCCFFYGPIIVIGPRGLLLVAFSFSNSSYSGYRWGLGNWNYGKLKALGYEIHRWPGKSRELEIL